MILLFDTDLQNSVVEGSLDFEHYLSVDFGLPVLAVIPAVLQLNMTEQEYSVVVKAETEIHFVVLVVVITVQAESNFAVG